jgi:phosphatidylserine decarboxylase
MFSILLQKILPHHLLSRIMLQLTRLRIRWIKDLQINAVIRIFNVQMDELQNPDPRSYQHFNAFFTRALKSGARPISEPDNSNTYCSPVDGTISQFGHVHDGRLFQAKGIDYSLLELIGSDEAAAQQFENGNFATIYLSPRDYHRVHMPAAGTLQSMTYIPGRLFSVADALVENLPNLFTRNERIVSIFHTANGPLAVVLVGAFFVGCMDTIWAGQVTPPHGQCIKRVQYEDNNAVTLNKGDEMGRFNMGSTVILLWPETTLHWNDCMQAGATLRLGQQIASIER